MLDGTTRTHYKGRGQLEGHRALPLAPCASLQKPSFSPKLNPVPEDGLKTIHPCGRGACGQNKTHCNLEQAPKPEVKYFIP